MPLAENPRVVEERVARKSRPYQVMCISIYDNDVDELEQKVAMLKARGWTNMNKSLLIRIALRNLDIDKLEVPRR